MSEEKGLDDDEASMMMIIDETMMSVDDTKMLTDDVDETLMMDDDETKKVGAEIRTRYYPNVVAQPCKRTRHGAKSTIARSMVAKQYDCKTLDGEIGGLQSDVINSDEEQDYSESVDTLERAIRF